MRTRFLNLDYFAHASSNFSPFPRLQPPSIDSINQPSPNLSTTDEILRSCSTSTISYDLDRFPIEDTLNRFFSDVLPHNLDIRIEDFGSDPPQIRSPKKETELVCEDNKDSEVLKLQIQTESANNEKDQRTFETIQFETPELDFFSEELFVFEKQEREILAEVPGTEIPMDLHNDNLKGTIPYPLTVSESVYSVGEIASEYNMEQKSCSFIEDDVSLKTLPGLSRYPLLEVNEITLELYTISFIEALHSLLESIGCQQLSQIDNLITDGKELLGSTEIDILECLSENCPLKQCFESEPLCVDLMLEVDFLCLRETTHLKGDSTVDIEPSYHSFPVISPVHFQEVEILDADFVRSIDIFGVGSEPAEEPDRCEQMFGEDNINSRNLYESIVNNELALVDDTFKLLPIPSLSDDIEIWLLSAVVEELLANLKPQTTSASDVIYLDWHLLQEDRCSRDICSKYRNMLEEIHTYSTGTELKSVNEEMAAIDSVFCFDTPDGSNVLERKEILYAPHTDVGPGQLFEDEDKNCGSGTSMPKIEAKMASSKFNSMSQFNDLDFFLNPMKAPSTKTSKVSVSESHGTDAKLNVLSSSNLTEACASGDVNLQKWNIEVHSVVLSDIILDIIDNLQKIYLGILENDTNLKKKGISFSVLDNLKLLSLPQQKLMEWIKHSSARNTTLSHEDDAIMPVVALYAIKQMAYYLCFYGIHTTHLYVQNLPRNFKYLKERLRLILSVIEDAHRKADNDLTASHPSLYVIQRILRSNSSRTDMKVLIIADQVFLYPLKKLLTSMKVSFDVLRNACLCPNLQDPFEIDQLTKFTTDALHSFDCLLISHEQVSASFPFNKFSHILEYGGSRGSSRISTLSPKCLAFPHVHFLKVTLEDSSIPKALSEGVDASQNIEFTMEGICLPISTLHKEMKNHTIQESLNLAPIEENYVYVESSEHPPVEPCSVPMSVSSMPFAIRSEETKPQMHSFPDTIIIMNTQNCDKELLISRRSSYQKILGMEKRGAQVVEREINLPVDLVFTAAMCLVWYNCINIRNKATATDEAFSCIPLWVENIATNVLTSLSFAFRNCILVFEGENRFLAAIMESSDGLYAAAASLGVGLQLFCSYSPETTDEIILSCIDYATKQNRGLYPKMFDSENLAESFLTQFPSMNPLSAHAILSSGGILVEFLEWSHAQRVLAIGKYHVHDESVALFSALCRYGEHEESKSGMTECSSASSAQDSICSISKLESRKRQKCNVAPTDISTDDCFIIEPLHHSTYCNSRPASVSQPYQPQIFSKSYDPLHEIEGSDLSLSFKRLGQEQCLDTSKIQNLERCDINREKNVYDDIMGEVIDLDSYSLFGKDLSIGNTQRFSMKDTEMVRNMAVGNSSTRRSPFNVSKRPAFPSSAGIKSYMGIWNSFKDRKNKLKEDSCGNANIETDMDMWPLQTHAEVLEGNMLQTSNISAERLGSRQNITRSYGVTSLSNAINSSEMQQGSPWTIEFLNKIKERKMQQQNGFSDEMKRIIRRSPSVLDSYRYRGGIKTKKIMKRGWHKSVRPPSSSSKNEKVLDCLLNTWTPADKRARQTLSFTKIGLERQSKLVWSDGSVPGPRKRC